MNKSVYDMTPDELLSCYQRLDHRRLAQSDPETQNAWAPQAQIGGELWRRGYTLFITRGWTTSDPIVAITLQKHEDKERKG